MSIFQIIILITGILTTTMITYTIQPQKILKQLSIEGKNELALMLIRVWTFIIFLLGCLVIYSSFNLSQSQPILLVVGISKVFFVSMLLRHYKSVGNRYNPVIMIDTLSALFYFYMVLVL